MRILLIIVALLLLPALATAGELDYWIDGLGLPAGSLLVHNEGQETLAGEFVDEFANLIPGKRASGIRVVNFDCPAGWESVQAHYTEFLEGQGYFDARQERIVKRIMERKGLERGAAEEKAQWAMDKADSVAGESLEFLAADDSYYVIVVDNAQTNSILLAMSTEWHLPAPDLGDFSLIVMQLEPLDNNDETAEEVEVPPQETKNQ